jgi:hypothetical protein
MKVERMARSGQISRQRLHVQPCNLVEVDRAGFSVAVLIHAFDRKGAEHFVE